MRIGENLFISPKYTATDYLALHLSSDSEKRKWSEAVNILKDRIEGRYFRPIKKLIRYSIDTNVDDNIASNGFAAMSLMCLLIDTFMQFRYGFPQTPIKKSNVFYKIFMKDCLGYESFEANNFYYNIRCGLLHSAETKNGSYLVPDYDSYSFPEGTSRGKAIRRVYDSVRSNVISVSVRDLFNELYFYFEGYCNTLMIKGNKECRIAFLTKMKSTVAKSELYYGDDVLWEGICKNQNRSILGSEANYFRYRCDAESRSLILWTERNPVESEEYISLVDIKDFIYCSNREIRSLLYNSNYIEKILELCKDEVKRFKKQYIK